MGVDEEVALDGEERAVFASLPRSPVAPDSEVFPPVRGMVGDLFDVAVIHGVVAAIVLIVADERLHVIFAREEAVIDPVVVARKEDPVVFGLELGRIVFDDGAVGEATVRSVFDDLHAVLARTHALFALLPCSPLHPPPAPRRVHTRRPSPVTLPFLPILLHHQRYLGGEGRVPDSGFSLSFFDCKMGYYSNSVAL